MSVIFFRSIRRRWNGIWARLASGELVHVVANAYVGEMTLPGYSQLDIPVWFTGLNAWVFAASINDMEMEIVIGDGRWYDRLGGIVRNTEHRAITNRSNNRSRASGSSSMGRGRASCSNTNVFRCEFEPCHV